MSPTTGTLHIGIGGFTAQGIPRGPAAGIVQRDIVGHAELAEGLGFDDLWLGEHHFSTDGYTAALFPMLGALAVRTKRLMLGTRVIQAPLHSPILLAENAAQVALLADGRFILGLGVGDRQLEFDMLGTPRADRAARLQETIAVCRKAWTGEPFDHHGPTVNVDGLICRPAPPRPPGIWLGGRASAALARVATMADGYVAPVGGATRLKELVSELDDLTPAWRRPLPISTGSFVLCSLDKRTDATLDRGIRAAMAQYQSFHTDQPGFYPEDPEVFGIIRGTPDQVTATLLRKVQNHADREHHLTMRVDFPGMTREQVEQHIILLATEVVPALRDSASKA